MAQKPIIKRYIDDKRWEKTRKDLQPLVKLINALGGEYSLQLRENYFNVYYQGNSLAKVVPNRSGTYSVKIHGKFVQGSVLAKLARYSANKPSEHAQNGGEYPCFIVHPDDLHRFFRRSNLDSLSSKIRAVHYGEEITLEQAFITDNPPTEKFIIIDRQVADHVSKAQMDLLALRRDSEDKPFHFQVIEVKLGRNQELHEKVGRQLSEYIIHIREHIAAYADCYEINYRQKKELGLFEPNLPDQIEIERDAGTVEGLVVVCGYSQLGGKAIMNLRQKIEENGWNIRVHQVPGLKLY
jgi:hypothetical protein